MEITGKAAPFFIRLIIADIIMMIMIVPHQTSYSENNHYCPPSSCGNIHAITHPFRLSGDPRYCGDPRYELSCKNNLTVLYTQDKRHYLYVHTINYNNYTIRVVDPNVHKDNLASSPSYLIAKYEIIRDDRFETEIRFATATEDHSHLTKFGNVHQLTQTLIFLSCEKKVNNSQRHNYIDTAPWMINNSALSQSRRRYSYVVVDRNLSLSDLAESCCIDQMSLFSTRKEIEIEKKNIISSYIDIHNEIAHGFELSWVPSYCYTFGVECLNCYVDEDSNKVHCPDHPDMTNEYNSCGYRCWRIGTTAEHYFKKLRVLVIELLSAPRVISIILVISLLVYKWQSRHLSMYDGIEEFLQSQNDLMPIRYSYWEIRKMTNGFKDKLGEGGFGSVYKGKLSSGHLVAVKTLDKSKANGQDFVNEVATIGRIHHVNVVRLIGFCIQGSTRALVYDFMPNGSLDMYIFPREGTRKSLNYKEIFEISLGVACGIEYLHKGCDMQILHFDIKPHNILLDENFIPKISDFGLARLCPLENSLISLTAARGTMGYIAPELFYKNIGGVSHKADVYSFGMLLMEMANKRKNLNVNAENPSQIYFPSWIYDQFSKGMDVNIKDVTEEELKTVKKMIIVALWCIQLKPCDRPSINKIVEMLEYEVDQLQMPPKPCLYPQEQDNQNVEDAMEERPWSSALSEKDSL